MGMDNVLMILKRSLHLKTILSMITRWNKNTEFKAKGVGMQEIRLKSNFCLYTWVQLKNEDKHTSVISQERERERDLKNEQNKIGDI